MPESTASTALLTLDVGTSAVKAVAYDRAGQAVAEATAVYGQNHPLPGRAEQDPDALLQVTRIVLAQLSEQLSQRRINVAGVCLSGTMHGIMAVAKDGKALTPLITWADSRAMSEAQYFDRAYGISLYVRTGVPLHPMTPLNKLLWLRRHEPETWAKAAFFCSFKEWLLWQLAGVWLVDEATAAATGFWQMDNRDWDDDLLEDLALTRDRLSRVVGSRTKTPASTPFAKACGLILGTQLVIGSTDGVLANLGSFGLATQSLAVTGGTSAALRQTVQGPLLDPQGRTFCYPLVDDYYVVGGGSNTGGMVLGRVAHWLGLSGVPALLELSSERESCPEGLLFLPYLAGERAPLYDPTARGSYIGLAMTHERADLARAAVDGVGYTLRMIQAALIAARVTTPKNVVASGGLAASAVWRQLLADQLQMPVRQTTESESTCLGAFLLGAQALGWYPTLAAASEAVIKDGAGERATITHCDSDRAQVYSRNFPAFQQAILGQDVKVRTNY